MPFSRFISPIRPIAAAMLSLVAAWAQAAPLAIDLPAQPLSTSIQQLSRQSGLSIGGNAALLEGKAAPAVHGTLEPADALRKLLQGSGLSASFVGDKVIIGVVVPTLKEVTVMGTPQEGAAEMGYSVERAQNVGPWGERLLQDTPYSLNVMPKELIENTQTTLLRDAFRYNPYTQIYIPASRIAENINMRGFFAPNRSLEGLPIGGSNFFGTEDIERIEVITGATGFMYGLGSPSGNVNLVAKRAPAQRLLDITVGCREKSNCYTHADLGGPINEDGSLGYRLNLVNEGGETFVSGQKIDRYLVSGALDYRVSNRLKLELNASRTYGKQDGMQVGFGPTPASGILMSSIDPKQIDPSKLYGQEWGYDTFENNQLIGKVIWDVSENSMFRSALLYQSGMTDRLNNNTTNNWVDKTKTMSIYHIFDSDLIRKSGYAYLDSGFNTGSVVHNLTVGFSYAGQLIKAHPNGSIAINMPGIYDLLDPIQVAKPVYAVDTRPVVNSYESATTNVIIGDDIQLTKQWSLLLGINRTLIDTTTYDRTTGAATAVYKKFATTPTVSLLFKPVPNVTTYVTYLDALEQGGVAPALYNGQPVSNAGQILAPMRDKQYELGAKTTLGGTLLTAAVFKIDKANQYVDPAFLTYVQDGRQIHQGLELTASGKVLPGLRIYGGATWLSAKQKKNTNNPAMEGKTPTVVPNKMAKLIAEYAIQAMPGLTWTGGAFYTGKYYYDAANTDRMPSVTIYDMGLRYRTGLAQRPLTLRLNISNITDKRYFMGNMIGDPRMVSFSATMQF